MVDYSNFYLTDLKRKNKLNVFLFKKTTTILNVNVMKSEVGFSLKFKNKIKIKLKKRGFGFFKPKRIFIKNYLLAKLNRKKFLESSRSGFCFKFPFGWDYLNFIQSKIVSGFKENNLNPFFGGVRKGTFKGFFSSIGIKEYVNRFLLPNWYRLQRFSFYKKYWKQQEQRRSFWLDCKHDSSFFYNITKQKSLKVYSHFYLRKRWLLSNILK